MKSNIKSENRSIRQRVKRVSEETYDYNDRRKEDIFYTSFAGSHKRSSLALAAFFLRFSLPSFFFLFLLPPFFPLGHYLWNFAGIRFFSVVKVGHWIGWRCFASNDEKGQKKRKKKKKKEITTARFLRSRRAWFFATESEADEDAKKGVATEEGRLKWQ